jgi:LPXTG-motif cell wall-anchored protein
MKLLNHQLAMGCLCLLLSAATVAQVQTETKTAQGPSVVQTKVERGEVLYVSGNDLVVKMENGEVRNFPNVPESARITVGGQQLSVHDLKPGMKLERTITTTSTPQTVTTVQTVTGRVFQVNPPSSVILTLEDGSNQQFKIPQGQKFSVDGKETDAFGLRKGMQISATRIVTVPANVTTTEKKVTGEMPPPPPATSASFQGPVLIVVQQAKPPAQVAQANPPAAQPEAKKLPQTSSELPLLGLIGTLSLMGGGMLFLIWSRERKLHRFTKSSR